MGCPINSIEQLENGLRYRKQKMVVVILASANSDSRATDFVLRNFHEMDILSDDVDFYLPGYGINQYNKTPTPETTINWIIEDSKSQFPDFHLNSEYDIARSIDSPRLGRIVFNVAEFTDFVLEFTRRIDGFHYLGGCQMVLLRPTYDGTPNYDEARVYDLDNIINSQKWIIFGFLLAQNFPSHQEWKFRNDQAI